MTPERAAKVHKAQGKFPYWGNYRKFMDADEIAFVEDLFQRAVSGNVSFASIVNSIRLGKEVKCKPL